MTTTKKRTIGKVTNAAAGGFGVAGSAAAVLIWVLTLNGVDVPAEMAAPITILIGFVGVYVGGYLPLNQRESLEEYNGQTGALFSPAEIEAQVDPEDAPSQEYISKHAAESMGDYSTNGESEVSDLAQAPATNADYEVVTSGPQVEEIAYDAEATTDPVYERPADIAART